jgi:methylated-DNA-[protein]-cysteine S-methyltransferase
LKILRRHLASCERCRRLRERDRLPASKPESPNDWPADAAVAYTPLASPLGRLWIAASARGIVALEYAVDELSFCQSVEMRTGQSPWHVRLDQESRRFPSGHSLARVASELKEYFKGCRGNITVPVDLGCCEPFRASVLQAVRRIPYGQARSYGQIAEDVGHPRAARAVGSAIAKNPMGILVPCHRVVRADGLPGEYGMQTLGPCGIYYKQALLDLERS